MFYKHWKKIALALTGFFWSSCTFESAAQPLYGVEETPNESSSSEAPLSSSSETLSSSEATISSSSVEESSSSEFFGAPIYGDIPVFEESSSSIAEESSSSLEYSESPLYGVKITCTPMDSTVAYFAEDYSVDVQKMWQEEGAKRASVDKIDSIKQTLAETPKCLEDIYEDIRNVIALYGAPTIIENAVDSCDDGSIIPNEEYAKFLKMKEEWEANKPALDEELQKLYENKMKEIEDRINKCLNNDV